jgi:hypothetical protein
MSTTSQYVEHADGAVVGGIEFGQVRECANHLFFDLLAAGRATRKLAHIGEHVRGALIYMLTRTYCGPAKQYSVRKRPKNLNYLIHNIFTNPSLSLIAHGIAEQIYLIFIGIGTELTKIKGILRKRPQTGNFCSRPRFRN